MIITQKKPMEELMAMVGDAKTVAIVGCNSCATACHTGGEPEVAALAKALEAAGKKVVGTTIADYCCMNLGVKGKMKPLVAAKPDCVICMSCGDGVQTVAAHTAVPVFPANDTLFLGQIERAGVFREACRMCGDCMLGQTGGICPVTQCAKSLVHGPCGGQRNGRCEVNPENECAWLRIYRKLKELDRLDLLEADRADKDYRSTAYPQAHSLREIRKKGGTP